MVDGRRYFFSIIYFFSFIFFPSLFVGTRSRGGASCTCNHDRGVQRGGREATRATGRLLLTETTRARMLSQNYSRTVARGRIQFGAASTHAREKKKRGTGKESKRNGRNENGEDAERATERARDLAEC